ncbi:TP901-1 family phage major tail protein [Enterococcus sp. AZ194]|uniref:phage major tail protein, TP901-1 family n=1 Tax=Enterococcus sp. AZ194 TaxID=2774629 RepID=UPI003F21517B
MTKNRVAEPTVLEGKKVVLFFRLVKERGTKAAEQLAFEINHTLNRERSTEETATKTGMIKSAGASNENLEMEFLASDSKVIDILEYAYEKNELVEFWRINLDKRNEEGKYFAHTGVGLLSTFPLAAEVESNATVSTTLNLNGSIGKIWATVSEEQEELAQLYYDTVASTQNVGSLETYKPDLSVPTEPAE